MVVVIIAFSSRYVNWARLCVEYPTSLVVIIIFSSRYVNWARLCVLGILPFGAITFLNTKIYIAVRSNFISNLRDRKSKCVYDKVSDEESWPNNCSLRPNFAGHSPSSGTSKLRAGTVKKIFCPPSIQIFWRFR